MTIKGEEVTLFYSKRSDITISMKIYFNEKNQLHFDGYDIGLLAVQTHEQGILFFAFHAAHEGFGGDLRQGNDSLD